MEWLQSLCCPLSNPRWIPLECLSGNLCSWQRWRRPASSVVNITEQWQVKVNAVAAIAILLLRQECAMMATTMQLPQRSLLCGFHQPATGVQQVVPQISNATCPTWHDATVNGMSTQFGKYVAATKTPENTQNLPGDCACQSILIQELEGNWAKPVPFAHLFLRHRLNSLVPLLQVFACRAVGPSRMEERINAETIGFGVANLVNPSQKQLEFFDTFGGIDCNLSRRLPKDLHTCSPKLVLRRSFSNSTISRTASSPITSWPRLGNMFRMAWKCFKCMWFQPLLGAYLAFQQAVGTMNKTKFGASRLSKVGYVHHAEEVDGKLSKHTWSTCSEAELPCRQLATVSMYNSWELVLESGTAGCFVDEQWPTVTHLIDHPDSNPGWG